MDSTTVVAVGRWASVLVAGLLATLALVSCGSDGDKSSAAAAPTGRTGSLDIATGTAKDSASRRVVNARVAGRTLSGHCTGKRRALPAVVFESGQGGDQNQLAALEQTLVKRTLVCAYDRAGLGASDEPDKTPRPLDDAVADLGAFIAAAKVEAPYMLVGHSAGAAIVFRHAQTHSDAVAGFVSMNPVPPAETFLRAARKVETKEEYGDELAFYHGGNEESMDYMQSERMLNDTLPAGMPYAVMFDEDCDGDAEFCGRILPSLTRITQALSDVGSRGRFVRAPGAGHDIFAAQPDLVRKTIDEILAAAKAG